jgi:hypothetical protein
MVGYWLMGTTESDALGRSDEANLSTSPIVFVRDLRSGAQAIALDIEA